MASATSGAGAPVSPASPARSSNAAVVSSHAASKAATGGSRAATWAAAPKVLGEPHQFASV